MQKPYSTACDRNALPILNALQKIINYDQKQQLLEVGSGTGQHAVFIAQYFPNLIWQTSDVESNHDGIKLWIENSEASNIITPVAFELGKNSFPKGDFDIVYTANTFHIISWEYCRLLITLCGKKLNNGALIIIYGPFNYNNTYSSRSNEEFDQCLMARSPSRGIRNFEEVEEIMKGNKFSFLKDIEMPANNRMLVFKKSA